MGTEIKERDDGIKDDKDEGEDATDCIYWPIWSIFGHEMGKLKEAGPED